MKKSSVYGGTILKNGQKLLFIGDSITDCGRRDAGTAPLGCGYVKLLNNLLMLREPAKRITLVNQGCGGNTAEDLFSRWYDDVITERPDWLVIMVGINDCNRFLCDPVAGAKASPAAYRDYLARCLQMTRKALPRTRIVLMTPFFLSRDPGDEAYRGRVNGLLPKYQKAMREIAKANSAILLDSHAAFERVLKHRQPYEFSSDLVHLNEAGALLLAEAVYNMLRGF